MWLMKLIGVVNPNLGIAMGERDAVCRFGDGVPDDISRQRCLNAQDAYSKQLHVTNMRLAIVGAALLAIVGGIGWMRKRR